MRPSTPLCTERVMSPPFRVAFAPLGSPGWLAGDTLLLGLVSAVAASARTDLVEMVMVSSHPPGQIAPLPQHITGELRLTRSQRGSMMGLAARLLGRITRHDVELGWLLFRGKVDALLGNTMTLKAGRVRCISWIPDFQHVHMPGLFPDHERQERSEFFSRSAAASNRVIVTSRAVQKDYVACFPRHAAKCVVLRPSPAIPMATIEASPIETIHRYRLPDRFFYVPNHFWTHKNHLALLDACVLLQRQVPDCRIILTGSPWDHRAPNHAGEFFQRAAEFGLREQLIYLGVVPRSDVLQLIRHCVALVNPSLFEGWGFTVSEAIALGKPVVASDIPTHREQAPPLGMLFDPTDPASLAEALVRAWRTFQPGNDPAIERSALAANQTRLVDYGNSFVSLVEDVVARPRV
jgi:glycosyltransferase involved in cell wall biosynthesis